MNFRSSSSAVTKQFAAILGKEILNSLQKHGATVLALQGELGAGKTTFAQGFLKGLGVKEKTVSPTFIIMREFALKTEGFLRLYHIDAYRLKASETGVLGFKEIFRNPKNIVLVEWAENIKKLIPKDAMWIRFNHKTKNQRLIKMKATLFEAPLNTFCRS